MPISKADQLDEGELVVIPERSRFAAVALLPSWITRAETADGLMLKKLIPQGLLTAKPMGDKGVELDVDARAAAAAKSPRCSEAIR